MADLGNIISLYDKEQVNVKFVPNAFYNAPTRNQIVVFNIPYEHFTTAEPSSFSQLSTNNPLALASRRILSTFTHLVQPRDITEIQAFESRSDASGNSVYVVAETLVSKNKKPVGERLWLFGREGFDFGEALRRMLHINSNSAKSKGLPGPQTKSKDKQTQQINVSSANIYSTIRKPIDVASLMWLPYTGNTYNDIAEHNNFDQRSVIHPQRVLCPEYAMTQFTERVCGTQKDLSQYYDENTGRFKKFPFPELSCHLNSLLFSPIVMFSALLPPVIRKHWFAHFEPKGVFIDDEGDMEMFAEDSIMENQKEEEFEEDEIAASVIEKRDLLLSALQNLPDKYRGFRTSRGSDDESDPENPSEIINEDSQCHMSAMEDLQRILDKVHNPSSGALHEAQQEEEFAESNDLLKLKRENLREVENITKKYKMGTPEYETAFKAFRTGALHEMWTSLMFSKNLSQGCTALRAYYRTIPDKKQFTLNFQKVENLSLFGNYIVFLMHVASKVHKILCNFTEFLLVRWTIMNAFHPGMSMNTHLHITGAHANGKSFAVDRGRDSCWTGAACEFTSMSGQALTIEGFDYSGLCWIVHEATAEFIGDDGRGKQPALTNILKNVLASSVRKTYVFHKDEQGARACQTIRNRSRCTWITLDNSGKLVLNAPMMDRFFVIASKKRERTDISMFESVFTTGWVDDPKYIQSENEKNRTLQLISMYVDLWMLAIDIGIMPPIDCAVFNITCKKVFKFLTDRGLPHPGVRACHMLQKYAIALWMEYVIYAVFFTELNVENQGSKFNPEMMMKLLPWSCISIECSLFIISLLEEKFVPRPTLKILKSFVDKSNSPSKNRFKAIPRPGAINSTVQVPGSMDYDLRYYEILGSSLSAMCEKVSNDLGCEFSHQQIQSELQQLRSKFVKSHNYKFDDNGIPEVDKDSEQESIPVITIDQNPQEKTNNPKRICISVTFLKENYDSIMEQAIQSICHKHQRKMTIITGLPCTGFHPAEPLVTITYPNIFRTMNLSPNPDVTLYIQNTYNITSVDEKLLYDDVETDENQTSNEDNAIAQAEESNESNGDGKLLNKFYEMQKSACIEVDDDLEAVSFQRMLEVNGIPDEESSYVALPQNSIKYIWILRKHPSMEKFKSGNIQNYPSELIDSVNKTIKERTPSIESITDASKLTVTLLQSRTERKKRYLIDDNYESEIFPTSSPSLPPSSPASEELPLQTNKKHKSNANAESVKNGRAKKGTIGKGKSPTAYPNALALQNLITGNGRFNKNTSDDDESITPEVPERHTFGSFSFNSNSNGDSNTVVSRTSDGNLAVITSRNQPLPPNENTMHDVDDCDG